MASNDHDNLTVLGTTVRTPIDHVEVFPAPADVTLVRFTSDEVSSICPVTAQPDVATVVIEYSPDKFCIESKSRSYTYGASATWRCSLRHWLLKLPMK